MTHVFRIALIAIRELIFERVFYLLLTFVIFALGLSVMLGQLTYAEQTKLTLDFMVGGIHLSMVLFSVFIGISLFRKELTMGSVSMILSKPISRTSFLLGKYFGQITVQLAVISFMILMTILVCSSYENFNSSIPLLQSGFLIFLEICILSAITYLFAVNTGAIVTALVAFSFFVLGHLKTNFESIMSFKGGGKYCLVHCEKPGSKFGSV